MRHFCSELAGSRHALPLWTSGGSWMRSAASLSLFTHCRIYFMAHLDPQKIISKERLEFRASQRFFFQLIAFWLPLKWPPKTLLKWLPKHLNNSLPLYSHTISISSFYLCCYLLRNRTWVRCAIKSLSIFVLFIYKNTNESVCDLWSTPLKKHKSCILHRLLEQKKAPAQLTNHSQKISSFVLFSFILFCGIGVMPVRNGAISSAAGISFLVALRKVGSIQKLTPAKRS